MTYGYIRVSTDKQTVENQRFCQMVIPTKSNAKTRNCTIMLEMSAMGNLRR
jgi:DNA invertase Pin-like site-specific DNA recombinase